MNKNSFLKVVLLLLLASSQAKGAERGFAIVVDSKTYQEVRTELDLYAASVEATGLKTCFVIDRWGVPDSLRQALNKLYVQKNTPIEGAVFIGDIPVAMIRDAQHLTSAFKMDQEYFDRKESSVPSDRFYDDFSLSFQYLGKEEQEPFFYYSLTARSPQKLSPDIYSARIKAYDDEKSNRYEKIRKYLRKVVRLKKENRPVDQLLYFSGNGYISESMLARIDEKASLLENFPWLNRQRNGISYIDHLYDPAVKYRVMNEMQRKDLDIAILHHHGDVGIQYMNGLPVPQSTTDEMNDIQRSLRKSLRKARGRGEDVDSVRKALSQRYDSISPLWFKGAFDPEVIKEDSLFDRSLDLYIGDFAEFHYTPNTLFVILDACFNGSFHQKESIANAYIFGDGNTVVVDANSVNVLQDKWSDRYLGLIGLGARAGYLSKENSYLEGHLFGDPTFTFASPSSSFPDLNRYLASSDLKWWKKQVNNSYPAIQAMALRKMADANVPGLSGLLLQTFKSSPSHIVRLECLMLLSTYDDDSFIECLTLSAQDSYEMIRRFAVNFMGRSGDKRLIPSLITLLADNNTDVRVRFNAQMAASCFEEEDLLAGLDRYFAGETVYADPSDVKKKVGATIRSKANFLDKYMADVFSNDSLSEKARLSDIRMLRNYHKHKFVPQLLEYLQKTTSEKEQVALLEALGWFNLSYRNPEIKEVAYKISQDTRSAEPVRQEALKTCNRLAKKGQAD